MNKSLLTAALILAAGGAGAQPFDSPIAEVKHLTLHTSGEYELCAIKLAVMQDTSCIQPSQEVVVRSHARLKELAKTDAQRAAADAWRVAWTVKTRSYSQRSAAVDAEAARSRAALELSFE